MGDSLGKLGNVSACDGLVVNVFEAWGSNFACPGILTFCGPVFGDEATSLDVKGGAENSSAKKNKISLKEKGGRTICNSFDMRVSTNTSRQKLQTAL